MKYIFVLGAAVFILVTAAYALIDGAGRLAGGLIRPAVVQREAVHSVPSTPAVPRSVPWRPNAPAAPSPQATGSDPAPERHLFTAQVPIEVWPRPSADGPRLGILRPGLPIAVVAEEGDWAKFVGPTGRSSWVERAQLVPFKR